MDANFAMLSSSLGGLIARDARVRPLPDEPRISTRVLDLGNVHALWPHIPAKKTGTSRAPLRGSGTGVTQEECLLPALGEAIERYCASVYTKEQFLWATAAELGREAIDLDAIPRCSRKELSHPKCPLIAPSKSSPIRWVQGLSLLDGRRVYLPAVMVYLYAGYASVNERIVVPITTGCAAHVDYEPALLSAILEIVERDALSILWLQMLPVPQLQVNGLPDQWRKLWEAYGSGSSDLRYLFFNATTDLGIPTVYGLRIAAASLRARTIVSCASALDGNEAVSKVIRDLTACAIGFRGRREIPEEWDDFSDVHHGAVYMADAARASAFEFLLASSGTQPVDGMVSPVAISDDSAATLKKLLIHLQKKGLDVYAADLSTDEALRAGVRAVRVVIPGLQPFPYRYRARYLGHPRLYSAPQAMGHRVLDEDRVNAWPNPFS
jgi:ribosomal protein S12 methylthiotransferase accessory factor